jgi:hypothetical protein
MHAEGENRRVPGKQRRRPVALVHVEVHHRGPGDVSRGLQRADAYRDVIEDAEALTMVREGMVRSPGEVSGEAFLECGTGRGARPAHRGPRAQDEPLAPGEAEAADFSLAEPALDDGLQPPRGVHPGQRGERHRLRRDELARLQKSGLHEAPSQQCILGHWKAVARGQRDEVAVRVKDAQGAFSKNGRGQKPSFWQMLRPAAAFPLHAGASLR